MILTLLVGAFLVLGIAPVTASAAVNFRHGFHTGPHFPGGSGNAAGNATSAQVGADTIRIQIYWDGYQKGVNQYDQSYLDAVVADVQQARAATNNVNVKALVNFDLPGSNVSWMSAAGYGLTSTGTGGAPRYYPSTKAGLEAYGQAAAKALKYLYNAGVADFIETPNEPNLAQGASQAIPPEKVGQLGGNAVTFAAVEGLQLNSTTAPAVLIGSVSAGQDGTSFYQNQAPADYFSTAQYYANITIDQWWQDKPGGPAYAVTLKGTWRPSFHVYPKNGANEQSSCQAIDISPQGIKTQDQLGDRTGLAAYQTVYDRLQPLLAKIVDSKRWWITETGMSSYKTDFNYEAIDHCISRRANGGSAYGKTEQSNFYSLFVSGTSSRPGFNGARGFEGVTFYVARDEESGGRQFAGYGVHSPGPVRKPAANTFEQLYGSSQPFPPHWTIDNLGGNITSDPDISSWGYGRLDFFARGTSNNLVHKWYNGSFSGWENLGGSLASGPGAVSWGANRIDVVGRAPDNSVAHWSWNGSTWVIDNLGGNITSDPDVSSWGYGRLDFFARGVNNDLVHKWYNGSFSGWESLGGSLASGPGAVSWGANRIDVVARGTDNTMLHWSFNGTNWVLDNLGGAIGSAPDISSWGYGRLDFYAKGLTDELAHKWYSGNFSWWEDLGGPLVSGPGAVSWAANRLDVVGRAPDNTVAHWAWQQ